MFWRKSGAHSPLRSYSMRRTPRRQTWTTNANPRPGFAPLGPVLTRDHKARQPLNSKVAAGAPTEIEPGDQAVSFLPFDNRNVIAAETGLAPAAEAESVIHDPAGHSLPSVGSGKPKIAATVTNLECPQQMAPADASGAEKSRKLLQNLVVWPGRNDTGYINMHVIGYGKDIGWPFRNIDAFINRARWADSTSNFFALRVCMSQQSQCTTTPWGKPKAVSEVANATWLRSIWIDCTLNWDSLTKAHKQRYQTSEEAWGAIVAFRKKFRLPFPSAVVDYWPSLQVYWISETPLTPDEWRPYAEGLSFLLRRERVKCETTCNSAATLPVPGIWRGPGSATLVHLGRQYDFSNALSALPTAAIEAEVSRLVVRRRKSRRVSGDPK